MAEKPLTFDNVNALDRAAFGDRFGGIFEHSLWVAERAWPKRPFKDTAALHAAMVAVVRAANEEEKLGLLRAHPMLAGKEMTEGRLTADGMAQALGRLHAVAEHWIEVPASAAVREQATRALRLHPLRAADALQLGAAIVAADHSPATMEFVTNDERLSLAAAKEGFVIKPG